MSEKISLSKNVYSKTQFEKTVDTSFSQLAIPTLESNLNIDTSINNFFNQYSALFYDIPKQGEVNSHEYLITTSQAYVGNTLNTEDLQPLLDEIDNLRSQILTQQELLQTFVSTPDTLARTTS